MERSNLRGAQLVLSTILATSIMLGLSPSASAFDYVLKDGDTLAKLAERFYGSAAQWRRIADANEGSAGFRAGQTIFIPEDGDPANPAARIVDVRGDVQLIAPGRAAVALKGGGEALHWQRTVRTGTDAVVNVKLRSGSIVQLAGDSVLTMLGEVGPDGGKAVRVRLDAGKLVFGGVDTLEELEVLTRSGLAVLRGHEVRFAVTDGGYSLVTMEGSARFGETTFHENIHVDIPVSGRRANVVSLPDPVKMSLQGRPMANEGLAAMVAFGAEPIKVSWGQGKSTNGYELEVEQLLPTRQIVARERLQGSATGWSMPVAAGGIFEARVRGLGQGGLSGRWTEQRFAVVRASASGASIDGASAPTWRGLTEVSFEEIPGVDIFMGHNESPRFQAVGPMLLAGAGEHEVAVAVRVAEASGSEVKAGMTFVGGRSVKIVGIEGVDYDLSPGGIVAGRSEEPITVTVSLTSHGHLPFNDDAPMVNIGHRHCRAELTSTPGVYQCTVIARRESGLAELPVVITGRGGSFTVVGRVVTP